MTEENTTETPSWVTNLYDDAASLEAGTASTAAFIADNPLVPGAAQLRLLREQLSLMNQLKRVVNARVAEYEGRATKAVQSPAHVAAEPVVDAEATDESDANTDVSVSGGEAADLETAQNQSVPAPSPANVPEGSAVDASGDDDEVTGDQI